MEPQIIDYYNEIPYGINVIDKMNDELYELQKKYDRLLKIIYNPEPSLEKCISMTLLSKGSHYDMACLFYNMYSDKFKCNSIKKNNWYFFDDDCGQWKESDETIELRLKLSNEIFEMYRHRSEKDFKGWEDGEVGEEYFLCASNYQTILNKLKDSTYKNKIIKECSELFYDKNFSVN